jgi:preprotein translocase SecE subunit
MNVFENQTLNIAFWILVVIVALNILSMFYGIIVAKSGALYAHKALGSFVKKVFLELKLVEWLSGQDTVSLTIIVLIASILLGGTVALFDFGLINLRDLLL